MFDVANAVIDGTDAGDAVRRIGSRQVSREGGRGYGQGCKEAEKQSQTRRSDHRPHSVFGRIDEAIAMSTMYTANHLGVAAIAALTESGSTTKWMSRISSGIPIYAFDRTGGHA